MKRSRWYVGCGETGRDTFSSREEPTSETHGHLYCAVWGPFRTKRGAEFGASPAAVNNPHVQTVADAERIAKSVATL